MDLSCILQRHLADSVSEYEDVHVLNWAGEYDVKYDNSGLTEPSSKRFLEDLLAMVRRGIDRKRTFSTTSSSSGTSVGSSAKTRATSTPLHEKPQAQPSLSITHGME